MKKKEKRDYIRIYKLYYRVISLSREMIFFIFSLLSQFFKINWTHISQSRMSSFSIVKYFYVAKKCYFGLFSTWKDVLTNTIFFECSPKALHESIIIAV